MNDEMWKEVEFQLFELGKIVRLKADDYNIWLINQREGNKLYTVVYVDGKFKFEWATTDCEIRRRFMCPSKKCAATKRELDKIRSQKRKNEIKEKYTYTVYSPYWASFKRLKKHLVENNAIIEMEEE